MIPCFNEEKTIKKVVIDWKKALPQADIYVYDNNSTDDSFEKLKESGRTIFEGLRKIIYPASAIGIITIMGIDKKCSSYKQRVRIFRTLCLFYHNLHNTLFAVER